MKTEATQMMDGISDWHNVVEDRAYDWARR